MGCLEGSVRCHRFLEDNTVLKDVFEVEKSDRSERKFCIKQFTVFLSCYLVRLITLAYEIEKVMSF